MRVIGGRPAHRAHCAAVVCHGGAGTVGALSHARPLLVLPQAADGFATLDGSSPPATD
jgi:UDP:flavonoid glycosyltransferase YjiC (YdhE family)